MPTMIYVHPGEKKREKKICRGEKKKEKGMMLVMATMMTDDARQKYVLTKVGLT